jgi:hypothetical protein
VVIIGGLLAAQAASQPMSPARYSSSLPPPETPISVEAPFGRFRIPIGYLKGRRSFSPQGSRRVEGLGIYFWMPEVGFVASDDSAATNLRPWEEGHLERKLEQYVVMVDWIRALDQEAGNWRIARVPRAGIPFDFLHDLGRLSGTDSFAGITRTQSTGETIGFFIECNPDQVMIGKCVGWMVAEPTNLAIQFWMPRDRLQDAFTVARQIADLINAWKVSE